MSARRRYRRHDQRKFPSFLKAASETYATPNRLQWSMAPKQTPSLVLGLSSRGEKPTRFAPNYGTFSHELDTIKPAQGKIAVLLIIYREQQASPEVASRG